MNDQTPRRLKGTLLERAAEHFQLGIPDAPVFDAPPPRMRPQTVPVPATAPVPVPESVPAPQAVAPVAEAPVLPAEPVVRLGSEVETSPEAPPVRPVRAGARRQALIDRNALAANGLLVPGGPVTVLAEEFRLIKRQLLLTARAVAGADADRARMVLVCSAKPDEGKSFCAINLALSMAAEKDVEILLVDADFAKPDILRRLGIAEGPGLLDALSGTVDVEDCIIDTDVPQLSVLPAGARSVSDTEWLASDRAHAVLDGLARANPRRIVIFDSPPVLAASPASVLALHAGQVMLVVRSDMTTESDLRDAVGLLDGCEHIQLVLNAVSHELGGRRFGTYYEDVGK